MKLKYLTINALIAAIYVVLTAYAFNFISFGFVQARVAEVLLLLLLIDKKYSAGLIAGCFIANLFSSFGIYDVIFGTLATALTCFAMAKTDSMVLKFLWPAIINGLIVGAELTYLLGNVPFYIVGPSVAIGEIISVFIPGMMFKERILKLKNSSLF